VSLDSVCVMRDCFDQGAVFDVHNFHSVLNFLFLQLVVHHLLQTHALVAKQRHQTLVVSTVAKNMVTVEALIVNVKVVEDNIRWRAHLGLQVKRNVAESEMAANK